MDWINQHTSAVYSAISLVILIAVYFAFKFKIDLWWTNLWYSIWKRRKLAGDPTGSSTPGWTNSEVALCGDYAKLVSVTQESEFRKRIEYLKKAQELSRSPMPGVMMVLLFVLVVAEGLGFSFMLGTWMALEGSENTHTILMWAIVFVLAVILVFIMHFAGHQLFHTNRIKSQDKKWRAAGRPPAEGQAHADLRSASVSLDDDQSTDDREPLYRQCANRIEGDGSYALLILAIVAIVAIAVTSTWMRYEHLRAALTTDTAPQIGQPAQENSNPFDTPVKTNISTPNDQPDQNDLYKIQNDANRKASSDKNSSTGSEGMAAFLMLAFIFTATQFVGITAGYRWGFASSNGKGAYRGTHGFSTFGEYQAFFSPAIHAARSQLQKLQQAMSENSNVKTVKTFDDYLLDFSKGVTKQPAADKKLVMASEDDPVADAIKHFDTLSDIEAKNQYLNDLGATLKESVMTALRDRKGRRSALNKLTEAEIKELEDL